MVPVEVALLEPSTGMIHTVTLAAMARYGIADVLASGPLSADEIAARVGKDPDTTHRTLRWLAGGGVFTLRPDGRFQNNRLSKGLMRGRRTRGREWTQYFGSLSNLVAWCDFDRILSELLVRHPHLRGMLADSVGVCAQARELLIRRGVAARVEVSIANFFDCVPLGADTYVLKNVLHD